MISGLGRSPRRACWHPARTRQPGQLSWRLQRCPLIMHRIVGFNGTKHSNIVFHVYANTVTAPHLGIRACMKKHVICLEIPDVEYTKSKWRRRRHEKAQQHHTSSRSDTDAFPSSTPNIKCTMRRYVKVPPNGTLQRYFIFCYLGAKVGIPRAKEMLGETVLPRDEIESEELLNKGRGEQPGAQATSNQLVHPLPAENWEAHLRESLPAPSLFLTSTTFFH